MTSTSLNLSRQNSLILFAIIINRRSTISLLTRMQSMQLSSHHIATPVMLPSIVRSLHLQRRATLIIRRMTRRLMFNQTRVSHVANTKRVIQVLISLGITSTSSQVILRLLANTARGHTSTNRSLLRTRKLNRMIITSSNRSRRLILHIITNNRRGRKNTGTLLPSTTNRNRSISIERRSIRSSRIKLNLLSRLSNFKTQYNNNRVRSNRVRKYSRRFASKQFIISGGGKYFGQLTRNCRLSSVF